MKLVMLLFLEEDKPQIERLFNDHRGSAWSCISVQGHGPGLTGWYGTVAPFDSCMAFTLIPDDRVEGLLAEVAEIDGLSDPRHPVHAHVLDVERSVKSPTLGGSA
jgi:hypothetical protein